MTESPETRLKRLYMRSIRRGIKEMDLILGGYAKEGLAELAPAELDRYESLLTENDHDLYAWVNGQAEPPETYASLIRKISQHFEIR